MLKFLLELKMSGLMIMILGLPVKLPLSYWRAGLLSIAYSKIGI